MKKFKKHFLAATLVIALGAAVYLNWTMTNTKPVTKNLGESKFVNATVSTTKPDSVKTKTTKKSQLNDKQKRLFAEAKTSRDQCQDKVIDTANEILNLENTPEKELTKAQSRVAGIIKNFTLQDTIESTLKAKGFSDVLCYITDDGCTVTVLKSELDDDKQIIIKATVKSAANIGFDKI
nr:SpoIIIAH-like family protein [Ruminococcus sp.]